MESLGFGSGELFEAAREEVTAFLRNIPPKKNGLAHAELPADNLVVRALAGDAKLADWLVPQLQSMKGKRMAVQAKPTSPLPRNCMIRESSRSIFDAANAPCAGVFIF